MNNTKEKNNELLDQVKHIAETIESGQYETDNEDGPNGFDYLSDVLDIQYIVSSKKEYLGARVLVGDSEFAYYREDNLELDEVLEEIYNCQ